MKELAKAFMPKMGKKMPMMKSSKMMMSVEGKPKTKKFMKTAKAFKAKKPKNYTYNG